MFKHSRNNTSTMLSTLRFCIMLLAICLSLASSLVIQTSLAQDALTASEPAIGVMSTELTQASIVPAELELRLQPLTKSELKEVASAWIEIARTKTNEVVGMMIRLRSAKGDQANKLRQEIAEQTAQRDGFLKKLGLVVNAWETKRGNAELIADYRAYGNSLVAAEVRQSDWRTIINRLKTWLTDWDGGMKWLITSGLFLVSILFVVAIARLVRRLARRSFSRIPNLSRLLQSFLDQVVYLLAIAVGLMVALTLLGFNITPLFAIFGGASFIAAFALQDTLGNIASGLMLMSNRPFDQGDFVDIAGTAGTVKSMSIVATTVSTPDNQLIVIPNSKVWGNIITNVTASPTRRVDLVFGIGYGDSIPKVQSVLEDVVNNHPLVLSDPEPVIRVHELAKSSVNLIVRPWVNSENYWTVYWDLMQQVKEQFDANNISIPFPQRDLHLHKTEL